MEGHVTFSTYQHRRILPQPWLESWIDYKQLYHTSWWSSFWGTWRMVAYSLLIVVTLAALIVGIILLVANFL